MTEQQPQLLCPFKHRHAHASALAEPFRPKLTPRRLHAGPRKMTNHIISHRILALTCAVFCATMAGAQPACTAGQYSMLDDPSAPCVTCPAGKFSATGGVSRSDRVDGYGNLLMGLPTGNATHAAPSFSGGWKAQQAGYESTCHWDSCMDECTCHLECDSGFLDADGNGCADHKRGETTGPRVCGAFKGSSIVNYWEPDHVIDGIRTHVSGNSDAQRSDEWTPPYSSDSSRCFMSVGGNGNKRGDSYLQVDLGAVTGKPARVDKVAVYNAVGGWGFYSQKVYLSETTDYAAGTLCTPPDIHISSDDASDDAPNSFSTTDPGAIKYFECEMAEARYVTVFSTTMHLAICQLEVFGSAGCSRCPAGRFAPTPGSADCIDCAPETFSAPGASECLPCAAGEELREGSAACSQCAPGSYDHDNIGTTLCHTCGIGKYLAATSTILTGVNGLAPALDAHTDSEQCLAAAVSTCAAVDITGGAAVCGATSGCSYAPAVAEVARVQESCAAGLGAAQVVQDTCAAADIATGGIAAHQQACTAAESCTAITASEAPNVVTVESCSATIASETPADGACATHDHVALVPLVGACTVTSTGVATAGSETDATACTDAAGTCDNEDGTTPVNGAACILLSSDSAINSDCGGIPAIWTTANTWTAAGSTSLESCTAPTCTLVAGTDCSIGEPRCTYVAPITAGCTTHLYVAAVPAAGSDQCTVTASGAATAHAIETACVDAGGSCSVATCGTGDDEACVAQFDCVGETIAPGCTDTGAVCAAGASTSCPTGCTDRTDTIAAQAVTGVVTATGVITTATDQSGVIAVSDIVVVAGDGGCDSNTGSFTVTAVSATTVTVSGLTGSDPTTPGDCTISRAEQCTGIAACVLGAGGLAADCPTSCVYSDTGAWSAVNTWAAVGSVTVESCAAPTCTLSAGTDCSIAEPLCTYVSTASCTHTAPIAAAQATAASCDATAAMTCTSVDMSSDNTAVDQANCEAAGDCVYTVASTPVCSDCASGFYTEAGAGQCGVCGLLAFDDDGDPTTPCVDCPPGSIPNTCADDVDGLMAAKGWSCQQMLENWGQPCSKDIGGWLGDSILAGRTWLSPVLKDLCPSRCGCPATECIACDPGTHLTGGECKLCRTGRADLDSDPSTMCEVCPAGRMSTRLGNAECNECDGSRIANTAGTGCTCSDGTFPEVGSSSTCITCPEGTTHWTAMPDREKITSLSAFSPACIGRQTYAHFSFFAGETGTFSRAAQNCVLNGGKLASMHSDAQRDAIQAERASGSGSAWIGLNDIVNEAGCTDARGQVYRDAGTIADDFVWIDGSARDYNNWAGGEPNDWENQAAHCDGSSDPGEDCALMRNDDVWNDAICDATEHTAPPGFICGFCPDDGVLLTAPLTGNTGAQCNNCPVGSYKNDAMMTTTCVYIYGTGLGASEVDMGSVGSSSTCIETVQEQHPTAEGVTYSSSGSCIAEFGTTGIEATEDGSKACLFAEMQGTTCALCPVGQYAGTTGTTTCTSCPSGQLSVVGSTSVAACTAEPMYLGCFADKEELSFGRDLAGAVTQMGETASPSQCAGFCRGDGFKYMGLQLGDMCYCGNEHGAYGATDDVSCGVNGALCGQNATQSKKACYLSVKVTISIVMWGEEISWDMDGGTTQTYTGNGQSGGDNLRNHVHMVDLSDADEHAFTFADSWGDGWDEGSWWQIQNGCDQIIGGGPQDGQVVSVGGTFTFKSSTLCCGGCDMVNAVFELSDWKCGSGSGTTCASGTVARSDSASTSIFGFTDAAIQAACCESTCLAWSSSDVCTSSTFVTHMAASVAAGTNPQASCCRSQCSAGTFDESGRCTPCAAGSFSSTSNAVSCSPCAAGSHAVDGATACTLCSAGKFDNDDSAQTPCIPCARGSFSATDGAQVCADCPAGTFSGAESTACEDCASGQYDDDSNSATPCLMCPVDTFSGTAATACTGCSAGRTASGGSSACGAPSADFIELRCPNEWAACIVSDFCMSDVAKLMAMPDRGKLLGAEPVLAVLACLTTALRTETVQSVSIGCVDMAAANYNPAALKDDGSCQYGCPSSTETCFVFDAFGRVEVASAVATASHTADYTSLNWHTCHNCLLQGANVQADLFGPAKCHFQYFQNHAAATDADRLCVANGGSLASILSAEDGQAVQATVPSGVDVWIGYNDMEEESMCEGPGFVWFDNRVGGDYNAWKSGSPDAYGCGIATASGRDCLEQMDDRDEDCVGVGNNGQAASWFDASCTDTRTFICGEPCPNTGYASCNLRLNGPDQNNVEKRTWDDAEAYCVEHGGHLASFHSSDEWDRMFGNGQGNPWIGFNDKLFEMGCDGGATRGIHSRAGDECAGVAGSGAGTTTLCGASCDPPTASCSRDATNTTNWVWSDGSPTDFTAWRGNEPDNWSNELPVEHCSSECVGMCTIVQSHEDCVALLSDQTWDDEDCDKPKAAVCGFPCGQDIAVQLTRRLQLVESVATVRFLRFDGLAAGGGGLSGRAAGLVAFNSTITLQYVSYTGNTQTGIGAAAVNAEATNIDVEMSSFSGNHNSGRGSGAMHVFGGSIAVVSNSQFTENTVADVNGADYLDQLLNSAGSVHRAAGIVAEDSSLTIRYSKFSRNIGGALRVVRTQFSVSSTEFVGNQRMVEIEVRPSAAAITVAEGSVGTITWCKFQGNVGLKTGALLVTGAATSVTAGHCAFIDNLGSATDKGSGGAFVSDAASLSVTHSTFDRNIGAAPTASGGIMVTGATFGLYDSTMTANKAQPGVGHEIRSGAGAIYSDSGNTTVESSRLQDNLAHWNGVLLGESYSSALYAKLPLLIILRAVEYEPFIDGETVVITPGSRRGVLRGSCQEHPCAVGNDCELDRFSLSCSRCTTETYSPNGVKCIACPEGMGSNSDSTGCDMCEGNNHSTFGVCLPCAPALVSSDDRRRCEDCGVHRTAVASVGDTRVCGCDNGYYNASANIHVCYHGGYDPDQHQKALQDHDEAVATTSQGCESCPSDISLDICLTCEEGMPASVSAGFTIPVVPAEYLTVDSRRRLSETPIVSVFRCHIEMHLAIARCPKGSPPGVCAEGYDGLLCAGCVDGYGMSPSRICEPCEDTGYTTQSMMIMAIIITSIFLIITILGKVWGAFPLKHFARLVHKQPSRSNICEI